MIKTIIRQTVCFLFFSGFIAGLLVGCDKTEKMKEKKKAETIITVKLTQQVTRLYFKGNLEPIGKISVLSPVEGRVAVLKFKYGDFIKK